MHNINTSSRNWFKEFLSSDMKIGDRIVLNDPSTIKTTTQKISVKCSCGNIKAVGVYYFVHTRSLTCGECTFYKFKMSGVRKFNSLTIIDDDEQIRKLTQKVNVKCDCGTTLRVELHRVYNGIFKSCGRCSVNSIKKSARTQFHKLTLITPFDQIKSLNQKVRVLCSCGNSIDVIYRNLIIDNSKSCGQCNILKFKELGVTKFWNLTLLTPLESIKTMSQKTEFRCKCGNISIHKLRNVVVGHTRWCGSCYSRIRKLHDENAVKTSIKYPIPPGILYGCIEHANEIKNGKTKLQAKCPICGGDWSPSFNDVVRGVALSCGCSSNKISTQNTEIKEHIESLGFIAELECKIGRYSYDVMIPSKKLVIEHHGLKWHATKSNKIDLVKYRNALESGYGILVIFADEWDKKRKQMCDIISYRLKANKYIKLRPLKCEIKEIDCNVADAFYCEHHYIGATKAKINIAAIYNDTIVACVSFKAPNRQSKYQYELTRMVSDPSYIVHGIWGKLFGEFVKRYNPKSIVSFSDNRLFTGGVYSKIGFKLDGDVRPDYYWIKGKCRYNKSGLRKPKDSSVTESELRHSQGFLKIWDVGKKRWVWKNE